MTPTDTERTEVEVWRGDALDLVTIVGSIDRPGCLTFVRLDDTEPSVRVRLHPRRWWICQEHGQPRPHCRHIDSAILAVDHRREELKTAHESPALDAPAH